MFALGLLLSGKRVVVVGGGAVSTRRVQGLLQAGGNVTVVSPVATADLIALAQTDAITLESREYRRGDLAGAWLAFTATGNADVDAEVLAEANANRIFCNHAGDADLGNAWVPALAREAEATVAVFGGHNPKRAVALRNSIAESLPGELARIDEALAAEALAARTASNGEVLRAVAEPKAGKVYLVGGGPGDVDLLTVRGARLIKEADVIVTDRLGAVGALDSASTNTLIINVGKMPDHHPVPQHEINQILIDQALAGKTVVRLKGGDPFIYGRGGEEVFACESAGVDVEVVPGISSAIAVPAAAGIPLTHRGVADTFTVVTGHEELDAIGGDASHTLVILMGVGMLQQHAFTLAAGRRGADCPVAIIESGYTPDQRITMGTLGNIYRLATAAGVKNPAVIVVGDVVRLSSQYLAELEATVFKPERTNPL